MTPFQLAALDVINTSVENTSAAAFDNKMREGVNPRFSELRNTGKGWEIGVRSSIPFMTRTWYPIDMNSIQTYDELVSLIRVVCKVAV